VILVRALLAQNLIMFIVAEWCPAPERSTLLAITLGAAQAGFQALSFSAGGTLDDVAKIPQDSWAKSKDLCGTGISTSWDLTFYSFGIFGGLAGIATLLFVADTPEELPWITPEELRYCRRYCKKDADRGVKVEVTKSAEPPIYAMLMEPAAWAPAMAHFSFNFSGITLANYLPTYFEQVFN